MVSTGSTAFHLRITAIAKNAGQRQTHQLIAAKGRFSATIAELLEHLIVRFGAQNVSATFSKNCPIFFNLLVTLTKVQISCLCCMQTRTDVIKLFQM
jgi:hypothetical protein